MRRLAPVLLSILLLSTPAIARAQEGEDDLRNEFEELKRGQEEIREQLEEIRRLLEARPAAPARPAGPDVRGKVFELGDNAVAGEPSARLTLIDFTDYQ